jgi:hypothetical protein
MARWFEREEFRSSSFLKIRRIAGSSLAKAGVRSYLFGLDESVKAGRRAVTSCSSCGVKLGFVPEKCVVSGKQLCVAGWTGWVERRE